MHTFRTPFPKSIFGCLLFCTVQLKDKILYFIIMWGTSGSGFESRCCHLKDKILWMIKKSHETIIVSWLDNLLFLGATYIEFKGKRWKNRETWSKGTSWWPRTSRSSRTSGKFKLWYLLYQFLRFSSFSVCLLPEER